VGGEDQVRLFLFQVAQHVGIEGCEGHRSQRRRYRPSGASHFHPNAISQEGQACGPPPLRQPSTGTHIPPCGSAG
jgi:hypothetical protein